jgi:hypothetical protein
MVMARLALLLLLMPMPNADAQKEQREGLLPKTTVRSKTPFTDIWMVGAFGMCGAGPLDQYSRDHHLAPAITALRKFQTLNFCTDPAALVQAHRKGMMGFLHIGLVANSSGERIWNVKCEQGECGFLGKGANKSGLLPGWEGALAAAIDIIGPALQNGSIAGVFLVSCCAGAAADFGRYHVSSNQSSVDVLSVG